MYDNKGCCNLLEIETDYGDSMNILVCKGRYSDEDRIVVFTGIGDEKVVLIIPPVPSTYCILPRTGRLYALVKALRRAFNIHYGIACRVTNELVRETIDDTLNEILSAEILDEICRLGETKNSGRTA